MNSTCWPVLVRIPPSRGRIQRQHHSSSQAEDFVFTSLTYDLKNQLEKLQSSREGTIEFPDIFLCVPKVLIKQLGSTIEIGVRTDSVSEIKHEEILNQLQSFISPKENPPQIEQGQFKMSSRRILG